MRFLGAGAEPCILYRQAVGLLRRRPTPQPAGTGRQFINSLIVILLRTSFTSGTFLAMSPARFF